MVIAADCDPLTTEDSAGFCLPNPTPTQWVSPTPTIIETITTVITEIITLTPTPTPESIAAVLKEDEAVEAEQFVLKPESESEIIVKDLPATVIVKPFLSTGKMLGETDIKEFPLDRPVTSLVESTRSGITKTKIVQIYPESVLEVSNDATVIKQSSEGDVKLELYYGYQTADKPWTYYYKVEGCSDGMCRVVRAEFDTKKVWIESVSESTITALSGIPAYEALP